MKVPHTAKIELFDNGCIRLFLNDAKTIFYAAHTWSEIIIVDQHAVAANILLASKNLSSID
jgi:hypothetical protein